MSGFCYLSKLTRNQNPLTLEMQIRRYSNVNALTAKLVWGPCPESLWGPGQKQPLIHPPQKSWYKTSITWHSTLVLPSPLFCQKEYRKEITKCIGSRKTKRGFKRFSPNGQNDSGIVILMWRTSEPKLSWVSASPIPRVKCFWEHGQ